MDSSEESFGWIRFLVLAKFILRLLAALLLLFTSYLPPFDSSASVVLSPPKSLVERWLSTLLRWDAFHFAHIAQRGYIFEYEWAFFPGVPSVMRAFAKVFGGEITMQNVLLGGAVVAVFCDTTRDIYNLTMHFTSMPSLATLATVLSLLPSSPATLHHAGYAEPFFAFFSYKGMIFCAKEDWLYASLCFLAAGFFRSNGFLLGGFILWGLVIDPLMRKAPVTAIQASVGAALTALPLFPFLTHQYRAYKVFCVTEHPAEWCSNTIPSVYSHVQRKYWDVGLLRYWTVQQLPNFLLSAPVLLLLFWSSTTHISSSISLLRRDKRVHPGRAEPLKDSRTLPYAIHALALTLILFFSSHTQIILRLASSTPYTYWAATRLWLEKPQWAKLLVGWSVVWGAVSIVLWGVFLPPA